MGILLINQAVAIDMDRLETARNNLNSVIENSQSSFIGEGGRTDSIDSTINNLNSIINGNVFGGRSIFVMGIGNIPTQYYHQELVDMIKK